MRYFLFAFVALGCNEQKLNSLGGDNAADGPQIEVDPLSLNFGVVRDDDDPALRTFTIKSVGFGNLNVEGIEISGQSGVNFTLLNDPGSFVLPAGATQDIDVIFDPVNSDQLVAQAIVYSDDPEESAIPVNLVGEAALPELLIQPDPLNFGITYVGCKKENEVTLTNIGTDDLEIFAIEHSGSPFTVTSAPALPITLMPAESQTVHMDYEPIDNSSSNATMTVISNEPLGIRTAFQMGAGEYIATYEQEWENPVDPPSDIIFSVDLSCSMDDDAANLASNFSSFIGQLSNYSNDWQIMVANDDNGCTNSGILTTNTSNYQGLFSSAVQGCSYCPWGEPQNTERLLGTSANAVENTDPGECNAGFMRSNALLHVVLVSDEPEQSPYSWDTYVNQMIAKKGDPNNLRISAIAGDYPGGCWGNGNSADPGTGYWEAVNATGGVFMSICSNWSSPGNLQLLAEASVIINSYPLDHPAVENTIEAFINNVQVTGTWHYDSSLNSVIFDTDPPEEGDTIRITYAALAECD